MQITTKEAASWLRENNDYLIITHIRPDGDTMGSGAALCYALNKIGKQAYLYPNPQFGDGQSWITEPYLAPEGYTPAHFISVDMASESMYPTGFQGKIELCFDHHPSNSFFAEKTVLEPEKASCGEIILSVVKELCELDSTVADLLYTAVSTDTGCFVYGNTKADTHRAAAELCDAGAANTYLNKLLFRTSSAARLRLEGLVYNSLSFYHHGSTVIAIVTKEMERQAGVSEKDCNDLAALPGKVEGAATSILIRENGGGSCKVSVRTNGIINASDLCSRFGGGGHAMAAGCSINADCNEAARMLLSALDEA